MIYTFKTINKQELKYSSRPYLIHFKVLSKNNYTLPYYQQEDNILFSLSRTRPVREKSDSKDSSLRFSCISRALICTTLSKQTNKNQHIVITPLRAHFQGCLLYFNAACKSMDFIRHSKGADQLGRRGEALSVYI